MLENFELIFLNFTKNGTYLVFALNIWCCYLILLSLYQRQHYYYCRCCKRFYVIPAAFLTFFILSLFFNFLKSVNWKFSQEVWEAFWNHKNELIGLDFILKVAECRVNSCVQRILRQAVTIAICNFFLERFFLHDICIDCCNRPNIQCLHRHWVASCCL